MTFWPTKFKHPEWFFLGVCVAAWGIGFLLQIGRTVSLASTGYPEVGITVVPFPVWPNILDVVGLLSVGGYMVWRAFR